VQCSVYSSGRDKEAAGAQEREFLCEDCLVVEFSTNE